MYYQFYMLQFSVYVWEKGQIFRLELNTISTIVEIISIPMCQSKPSPPGWHTVNMTFQASFAVLVKYHRNSGRLFPYNQPAETTGLVQVIIENLQKKPPYRPFQMAQRII